MGKRVVKGRKIKLKEEYFDNELNEKNDNKNNKTIFIILGIIELLLKKGV